MALIEHHHHGMPSWVDAMVDSGEQLVQMRNLLSSLFHWSWDHGTDDTGHYSIARDRGRPVCGLGQSEGSDGRFVTYFATDSVVNSIARATSLGGTLTVGPFEVMEQGSMALVRDPVGVLHGLWQPNTFEGFGVVRELNTPGWFDHASGDPSWAAEYYAGLTGHSILEPEPGMLILMNGEEWFASFSEQQVAPRAPRWNALYVVDSLARIRETIVDLGGHVLVEEMPVPGTTICIFTEPVCGNVMTVMAAGPAGG